MFTRKKALITAVVLMLGCYGSGFGQTPAPPRQTPLQQPTPAPKAPDQNPPAPPAPVVAPAPITAPSALEQATPKPPRPPRTAHPPRAPEARQPDGQSGPVTAKLGRGGKVAITGRFGSVKVSGWDKEMVEATPTGDSGPLDLQSVGDETRPRVVISASRRYARECDVEVKVPRYADVETSGGLSGDIEVSDVEGKVEINAGMGDLSVSRVGALTINRLGGDITVANVKGELIVRSTHGDVAAENVGGRVEIAVTSGDVRVASAGGDVRVTSAAGDIELHCVKGGAEAGSASGSITLIGVAGDAEASTSSGDVVFKGQIRAGGTYNFKSLSGDVEMVVQPDPPGFTATLTTYSGEIDTSFPLKLDSSLTGGSINRRVVGRYGDGQAKVKLDSFHGGLRVVKGTADLTKQCK